MPWILALSKVFPVTPGPRHLATTVHSPVKSAPFRVSCHIPAVRPGGRTDFPEIPRSYNDVTRVAPHGVDRLLPLRFRSQAFSTSQRFPGKPELRGLVSCRSHSWTLLLQSFPLTRMAHPSRGRWLPCGYPPACRDVAAALFAARFTDSRTLAQSPGSPTDYGLPFRAPKRTSRPP